MTDDLFDRFVWIGLPLATIAAGLAWLLSGNNEPADDPEQSEAFGCYVSEGGRALQVDAIGFRTLNPPSDPRPFELYQANSGLRLRVQDPPLQNLGMEKFAETLKGRPISLTVITNLDTPRLVDGIYAPSPDAGHANFYFADNALCTAAK